MMNVKIGDVIEATGLGKIFTVMVGGIGRGEVIHVENPEGIVSHPRVHEEIENGLVTEYYLKHGILYIDERVGLVLWLAPEDFVVIDEK